MEQGTKMDVVSLALAKKKILSFFLRTFSSYSSSLYDFLGTPVLSTLSKSSHFHFWANHPHTILPFPLKMNASLEESTAQTPYLALQSMFVWSSVAPRMGRSCLETLSSDWQKPSQWPLQESRNIEREKEITGLELFRCASEQIKQCLTHQELQSTSCLQKLVIIKQFSHLDLL